MAEVALDASYTLHPLHPLVYVDWHAKVRDVGIIGDACNVGYVILCQHMGLRLVQLQITHFAEVF